MSHTIKTDETHGTVLLINNSESLCPFQQALAVPVQNSFGHQQLQIIRFPCSTKCPYAEIYEERPGIKKYAVKCTGIVREFILEPEAKIKAIDDLIN